MRSDNSKRKDVVKVEYDTNDFLVYIDDNDQTNDGYTAFLDGDDYFININILGNDLDDAINDFCRDHDITLEQMKSRYHINHNDEQYQELYDKAFWIMVDAHRGQKDKAGNDYRAHPLNVAASIEGSTLGECVALLHDTIEDTNVTADYLLSQGFPQIVVNGILSVTRNKERESYADFIERASKNYFGKMVKIADLESNMDIRRLNDITDVDAHRLRKYLHAWRYLNGMEKDTSLIK